MQLKIREGARSWFTITSLPKFAEQKKILFYCASCGSGPVKSEPLIPLEECDYPHVIILTPNTNGHIQMMEEYTADSKWNVKYMADENEKFGLA